MGIVVILEDEFHAEWQGRYDSVDAALEELRLRAALPWDQEPNACPCMSWRTCHRDYQIVEYDDATKPWRELRSLGYLKVSHQGAVWSDDLVEGRLPRPEHS